MSIWRRRLLAFGIESGRKRYWRVGPPSEPTARPSNPSLQRTRYARRWTRYR